MQAKLLEFGVIGVAFRRPAACLVVVSQHDLELCDLALRRSAWQLLVQKARRQRVLLHAGSHGEGHADTPTKAQQVRNLFTFRSNPMTKAQVVAALPDVSLSAIENALRALVREGYLDKIGAGRSTAYLRK